MRFSFLPVAFAALTSALDLGLDTCELPVYDAIQLFADYAPALDYCSKAYPIPWKTETHWRHHTKTWTATITLPTTTLTETETTTVSIVSKKHRRAAANSAKAWAEVTKVLKKDGKLEPGCSCIETTPITTVSLHDPRKKMMASLPIWSSFMHKFELTEQSDHFYHNDGYHDINDNCTHHDRHHNHYNDYITPSAIRSQAVERMSNLR